VTAAVSVLDYGIGNLLSVTRALSASGAEPRLVTSADEVRAADRLIVPGVGAFGRCSEVLQERGLTEAILSYCGFQRPFLGICVGMQLMMDFSTEFGRNEGFGLVPGKVDVIPATGDNGKPHKIPHIGWSQLRRAASGCDWGGTPLEGIDEGSYVYFVHSYTAYPDDPAFRVADAYYDGCEIAAMIGQGSLFGVQFHPEKSGQVGLQMLSNFVKL
jgi:glutamine amidotransferase